MGFPPSSSGFPHWTVHFLAVTSLTFKGPFGFPGAAAEDTNAFIAFIAFNAFNAFNGFNFGIFLTENDDFDFGLVFSVFVFRSDQVNSVLFPLCVRQVEFRVVVHVHDFQVPRRDHLARFLLVFIGFRSDAIGTRSDLRFYLLVLEDPGDFRRGLAPDVHVELHRFPGLHRRLLQVRPVDPRLH